MPVVSSRACSAVLRNEIRNLIAVYALDMLYKKGQMTLKLMYDFMGNVYHGNDSLDFVSHISLFLDGNDPYGDLFEEEVVTNRDGPSRLTLKHKFHRQDVVVTVGKNEMVTREVLECSTFSKNAPLILGRTIYSGANGILRTVKKAIAFAKPLLHDDGTPIQSGMTEDDVIEHVLKSMFRLLKGKQSLDDAPENGAEDEAAEERAENENNLNIEEEDVELPPNWIFNGFSAFLYWGPLRPPNKRLNLFYTDAAVTGKKSELNRASARKEDAKEKAKVRANTTDERGFTLHDKIHIANLEMRDQEIRSKQRDSDLINLYMQAKLLQERIVRAEKRGDNKKVEELEALEQSIHEEMEKMKSSNSETNSSEFAKEILNNKRRRINPACANPTVIDFSTSPSDNSDV